MSDVPNTQPMTKPAKLNLNWKPAPRMMNLRRPSALMECTSTTYSPRREKRQAEVERPETHLGLEDTFILANQPSSGPIVEAEDG